MQVKRSDIFSISVEDQKRHITHAHCKLKRRWRAWKRKRIKKNEHRRSSMTIKIIFLLNEKWLCFLRTNYTLCVCVCVFGWTRKLNVSVCEKRNRYFVSIIIYLFRLSLLLLFLCTCFFFCFTRIFRIDGAFVFSLVSVQFKMGLNDYCSYTHTHWPAQCKPFSLQRAHILCSNCLSKIVFTFLLLLLLYYYNNFTHFTLSDSLKWKSLLNQTNEQTT